PSLFGKDIAVYEEDDVASGMPGPLVLQLVVAQASRGDGADVDPGRGIGPELVRGSLDDRGLDFELVEDEDGLGGSAELLDLRHHPRQHPPRPLDLVMPGVVPLHYQRQPGNIHSDPSVAARRYPRRSASARASAGPPERWAPLACGARPRLSR